MNEITFVEVDAAKIEAALINNFETATGETFYPGDERRIFLLQEVPVLVGQKNDINYTGNQNLLPFAVDEALDGLGQLVGVSRLPAQQALTTISFTLSEAQLLDVTIPMGTRVTPDGLLYFGTTEDLILAPGNISGAVLARATAGGAVYNGFVPGQIKTIVDPVPYVASAVNVDTSYNGSEIESNDSLRERIQLAPESFSVAGPSGGYIYWAKTADINIGSISVISPSPGNVNIYVLMKKGIIPTQPILDKVNTICSDKKIRPLTDYVHVLAPTVVNYDIDITYYIKAEKEAEVASIRKSIEDAGGAVDEYIAWQCSALGRDINVDYLNSLMFTKGAFRIVPSLPVFTLITDDKVAFVVNKNIVYGGLI